MLKNATQPTLPIFSRRSSSSLRCMGPFFNCIFTLGPLRIFTRRQSIHIRPIKLQSAPMIFVCSSFSTMRTSDSRVSFNKLYWTHTRCTSSGYCSQSHEVKCSSPRQTRLLRFCSVCTSPRFPASSLFSVTPPCFVPVGALSLSTFSQPSNLPPHSSRYGAVFVRSFLTTPHHCCNGHLHSITFHSSVCNSLFFHFIP